MQTKLCQDTHPHLWLPSSTISIVFLQHGDFCAQCACFNGSCVIREYCSHLEKNSIAQNKEEGETSYNYIYRRQLLLHESGERTSPRLCVCGEPPASPLRSRCGTPGITTWHASLTATLHKLQGMRTWQVISKSRIDKLRLLQQSSWRRHHLCICKH